MELVFQLEQINSIVKAVIEYTKGRNVFAMHGEMGAGKTTFVHAFCQELGVKDPVSSPTFSVINQYSTPSGKVVYHIDLYRLKDKEEVYNTGVEDCLFSGGICFVEWPELAPEMFPDFTVHLILEVLNSNTRKLKINL